MAKFTVLLSLLVAALVALSTSAFAPKPAFGKFREDGSKAIIVDGSDVQDEFGAIAPGN